MSVCLKIHFQDTLQEEGRFYRHAETAWPVRSVRQIRIQSSERVLPVSHRTIPVPSGCAFSKIHLRESWQLVTGFQEELSPSFRLEVLLRPREKRSALW